jgi:hypothetical protein
VGTHRSALGVSSGRLAPDAPLNRPGATGTPKTQSTRKRGRDGAKLLLVGSDAADGIVIVRVEVAPAPPNPMLLALPNVLLVFHLNQSPDERWKTVFDSASNGIRRRGLMGLMRRVALRNFDPPSITGAKIRWAVPSDEVEEAEQSIRQRVDATNAQIR